MPLRPIVVGCHLLLATAIAAHVVATAPTAPRLVLAALLTLPLLLALRGLVRGQRAVEQRLAVLLVLYVGGASVEVVAQAGRAPLLGVALLAASLELALLLALIRRGAPRAPAARE
jgi:uncharacterized membrane protein